MDLHNFHIQSHCVLFNKKHYNKGIHLFYHIVFWYLCQIYELLNNVLNNV